MQLFKYLHSSCLVLVLALIHWVPAFSAPGTDPVSEIEVYLDQIRAKIDSIQQSVNEIEEPPLAEKVVDTFSFSSCASLGALAIAGGGFDLTVPVKLEGEAQPGLKAVSALVQAWAAIDGSVSGSLDGTAALDATVCLDLYKLSKVLVEEALLQVGDEPVGLLGDLSQDTRNYLLALAHANPTQLYNTLLTPVTNQQFGFNPSTLENIAYALDGEILSSQFAIQPAQLLSNAEDQLARIASIVPFAGNIRTEISSIFTSSASLNPCTYQSDIPGQIILEATCTGLGSAVANISEAVDILDNILLLSKLEQAVNTAETVFGFLKNTTLVAIDGLISGLNTAKDGICGVLDPIVNC